MKLKVVKIGKDCFKKDIDHYNKTLLDLYITDGMFNCRGAEIKALSQKIENFINKINPFLEDKYILDGMEIVHESELETEIFDIPVAHKSSKYKLNIWK